MNKMAAAFLFHHYLSHKFLAKKGFIPVVADKHPGICDFHRSRPEYFPGNIPAHNNLQIAD
jgi:hypothetical protein